jgi:hypothetical protein
MGLLGRVRKEEGHKGGKQSMADKQRRAASAGRQEWKMRGQESRVAGRQTDRKADKQAARKTGSDILQTSQKEM